VSLLRRHEWIDRRPPASHDLVGAVYLALPASWDGEGQPDAGVADVDDPDRLAAPRENVTRSQVPSTNTVSVSNLRVCAIIESSMAGTPTWLGFSWNASTSATLRHLVPAGLPDCKIPSHSTTRFLDRWLRRDLAARAREGASATFRFGRGESRLPGANLARSPGAATAQSTLFDASPVLPHSCGCAAANIETGGSS